MNRFRTTLTWMKRDLVEERAAIIEEGEKCSRQEAERRTAQFYGFDSWAKMMEEINGNGA